MIEDKDIKKLKKFLSKVLIDDDTPLTWKTDTDDLAEQIADVLNGNIVIEEPYENYNIYQTKENFIDIVKLNVGSVYTNDIEKILDAFCKQQGDTYMYDIDTLTCFDKYGNEFVFKKE